MTNQSKRTFTEYNQLLVETLFKIGLMSLNAKEAYNNLADELINKNSNKENIEQIEHTGDKISELYETINGFYNDLANLQVKLENKKQPVTNESKQAV